MKSEVIRIFSKKIRSILERVSADFLWIEEIRLRSGQPLAMCVKGEYIWVDSRGGRSIDPGEAYVVKQEDINETLEYVSHYSLYAFEEELRQGYITIPGGHRVGLTGKAVVASGEIRSLKYISFLNIRLAHQVIGCADPFLPYIWNSDRVGHTLIISPPRMGKTTLLRDLIRQISDGSTGRPAQNVAVADERSEIAACVQGIPQNDLGRNTDVMDGCPKADGIRMLIRTMSPQVIAMDEVGGENDLSALVYGMNCGCAVLATIHGESPEDIRRKPIIGAAVQGRLFDTYIMLNRDRGRMIRWQIFDRGWGLLAEGVR